MSKERRTVSLEEEVDEYLNSDEVNASALVNQLVKNHATSGGNKRAMLELREEQLMSEIDGIRSNLQQKQDELERVQEQLREFQDETTEVIKEAAQELRDTPLDENNPAIQNWAEKAELPVAEFINRLEQHR